MEIEKELIEFTNLHDEYISGWNKAMTTGDTTAVEKMYDNDNYFVVFLKGANEKPIIYSKEEALSGMKDSVRQLLGAKKEFKNRIIRLRNYDNAVVFYEQLIEKDDNIIARLFTIENWQLIDGLWMLTRETEEPI